MGNNSKSRNAGLDLLRSLCILYIVGYWHMLEYTEAFPQYNNIITLRITWIILATFIFLSGYFIGLKSRDISKEAPAHFYRTRLLRIYPLYVLALAIFYLFGMSDFLTSLKASFAISMFYKPAPPTLWFITMLLFFYILSPFLVDCIRNDRTIFIVVAFILVSGGLLLGHFMFQNLDVRVITYFPAFLLGLYTSMKGESFIHKKACLCICIVGAMISLFLNQNIIQMDRLLAIFMVTTAPYFIFFVFKNKIEISDTLYKTISIFAYSSYCMYLFHRPIYMVLSRAYFPESEALQVIYLVCFCLPCILVFSYCIQKVYNATIESLTKRPARLADVRR